MARDDFPKTLGEAYGQGPNIAADWGTVLRAENTALKAENARLRMSLAEAEEDARQRQDDLCVLSLSAPTEAAKRQYKQQLDRLDAQIMLWSAALTGRDSE